MSQLNVDNIQNRTGSNGGPNFPSGITVAVGQTAYIHGNLQVDGTETIINTETLNVSDKTVGIGSTSNASNTTADGSGIEIFASSSQTGNNKTLTWQNSSSAWTFGGGGIVATDAVVGSAVTSNASGIDVTGGINVTGVVTATSFKGDGSLLTGIDATSLKDGGGNVKIQANSDGAVVTGVVTATSFVGDGANLTNLPASGNVITGIASGAIASDKCMGLAHDGKILQIALKSTAIDPPSNLGSAQAFNNTNCVNIDVLYSPDADRFLKVYSAENQLRYDVTGFNGNNPTSSNVAQVDSNLGNPNTNVGYDRISTCYDTYNDKCFVVFHDNTYSDRARCIVGTMTPTNNQEGTMAWGTPVYVSTSGGDFCYCCFDSTNNKIIVTWRNRNNNYLMARVGSISGNSITFGTELTVSTGSVRNTACSYDVNAQKVLITWENMNDSQKMYGIVGTVSSNSMTFGTATDLSDGSGQDLYTTMCYDPDGQQTLALYKGTSGYLRARVFTISGTSVSGGTATTVYSGSWYSSKIVYDTSDNRAIVFYEAASNSNAPRVVPVSISGTTLSAGSFVEAAYNSGQNSSGDVDNKGSSLIAWQGGAGYNRKVKVSNVSGNIGNKYQYVGFADTSYTNGQTVTVKTVGNTIDTLSGLTTSSVYYVQGNGTVATTWDSTYFSSFANDTPVAGRAISSTTLQIFQP